MKDVDSTEMATRYQTVLHNWDARSAVRSKARHLLQERQLGRNFFSAALVPAAGHPLVQVRGPGAVDELLVRRLGTYMDFTVGLEQEIVNPVLARLAGGRIAALPPEVRLDAHRIYCDEAYHALSAFDLKWQVERWTGVPLPATGVSCFHRVLYAAKQHLVPGMHDLVDFCAAVVSETLISGVLSKVPADHSVVSVIRDAIAEHAEDERRHHAYFTKVFEIVWPALDRSSRLALGPLFADLIVGFLAPDHVIEVGLLRRLGLDREAAEQVFAEVHPAARVMGAVRNEGRATLRLLDRLDVLSDSRTFERFEDLGLITTTTLNGTPEE